MKKVFKKFLTIAFAATTLTMCACGKKYEIDIQTSTDFRGSNLGDSLVEVIANEENSLTEAKPMNENTYLMYSDIIVDGVDASIIYMINENDELYDTVLRYYVDDVDNFYKSLVEKCDQVYGTDHFMETPEMVYWEVGDYKYINVFKSEGKVFYCVTDKDYFDLSL